MITADGRGDVKKLARWYFQAIQRGALTGIPDLITHRVPFSDIEAGFQLMESDPESVVKILITYP